MVSLSNHEGAWTLKIWEMRNGLPWLGTLDPRIPGWAAGEGYHVFGRVVGHYRPGRPRYRLR